LARTIPLMLAGAARLRGGGIVPGDRLERPGRVRLRQSVE